MSRSNLGFYDTEPYIQIEAIDDNDIDDEDDMPIDTGYVDDNDMDYDAQVDRELSDKYDK